MPDSYSFDRNSSFLQDFFLTLEPVQCFAANPLVSSNLVARGSAEGVTTRTTTIITTIIIPLK